jgi:hypothetical protein
MLSHISLGSPGGNAKTKKQAKTAAALRAAPLAFAALAEPRALTREEAAFVAQQAPVTVADLTVAVSAAERAAGLLEPATVARAAGVLAAFGVVKLGGAWAAEPVLVEPAVAALHDHLARVTRQLAAKGLSPDDAFGYRQIVHRSLGRYDLSLEGVVSFSGRQNGGGGAPPAVRDQSAGVQVMRALLASPRWKPLLAHVLGPDYKTTVTAALLAKPGCAEQAPHCDGGHLFHATHGFGGPGGAHVPAHALQLFLPLCDTPVARGPTEFWPGSHLGCNAAWAHLMPHRVALEATSGDAILFDFRVRHRGLANRSDQWRPILYQTCSRAWFTDDFNFPDASLDDDDGDGGTGAPAAYESGTAGTRAGFVRRSGE